MVGRECDRNVQNHVYYIIYVALKALKQITKTPLPATKCQTALYIPEVWLVSALMAAQHNTISSTSLALAAESSPGRVRHVHLVSSAVRQVKDLNKSHVNARMGVDGAMPSFRFVGTESLLKTEIFTCFLIDKGW